MSCRLPLVEVREGGQATLLLVEDSEDDTFLMVRALKQAGVEVPLEIVTDGGQALE